MLYCGLAVTSRGVRVVEFNVRFGDPETQAVLERLETRLGQLLHDAAVGALNAGPDGTGKPLAWKPGAAVDVVLAAANYPETPQKGDPIEGLDRAEALEGVSVLHAGTAADDAGRTLTISGRVLAVVGNGASLAEARDRAYAGVEQITWPGAQHRTDIAAKALGGEIRVASQLPGWVHAGSGKVRELYTPAPGSEWDGQDVMLLVTTDRVSAFDHVLSPGIPDKGRILTQMSLWWFRELEKHGIANHVVSTEVPAAVEGRAVIVRRLSMVSAEAIVRGFLTGSGLKEYQQSRTVTGIPLPAGLVDGSELPEPLFTPSTKAEQGDHDENITYDRLVEVVGSERASALKDQSLRIYELAGARAREAGIILADTKVEFGIDEQGAWCSPMRSSPRILPGSGPPMSGRRGGRSRVSTSSSCVIGSPVRIQAGTVVASHPRRCRSTSLLPPGSGTSTHTAASPARSRSSRPPGTLDVSERTRDGGAPPSCRAGCDGPGR